jgi:hypothetical protein
MPVTSDRERGAASALAAIERFLGEARQPVLLEPGEDLLPLVAGSYLLEMRGSRLVLQAWDRTRNLVRRVIAVSRESRGRLELVIERFARKEGRIFLLDVARPAASEFGKRSARLVFRERFRLFLHRQFAEWTLADLSSEADLEHSLSPAYPRGFLRHGQHGWAAIAAPPEADAGGAVTFGLIWLTYLRAREKRLTVEGLAIYVPAGKESAAALRVLCLDGSAARFELFSYTPEDVVLRVDPRDHGNIDTRLEPCRRAAPGDHSLRRSIEALPAVEAVPKQDGRTSLRVRGLEFAVAEGSEVRFGLADRIPATEHHLGEIESLVDEIDRARSPHNPMSDHPFYGRCPEAWLESMVRADLENVDASLLPSPLYGQVPAMAGGERGVIDLLALGRDGRLAVIELKASADVHLPLQALDYWIRVKWHLDRGEFTREGYFPGLELRPAPPRLLLISPSLEFHPTSEAILSYFSSAIDVVRIGVGVEWRKGLHVMFRLTGAAHP